MCTCGFAAQFGRRTCRASSTVGSQSEPLLRDSDSHARASHERMPRAVTVITVSRQAIGNALAGVLFLIVGIWDFTRDDSGIGVVFVIFAAVFLGLAFSGKKRTA